MSEAVPESASRDTAAPGIIAPPRSRAFGPMTLIVVAVPMSMTMTGGSRMSSAATAPATRSAPIWEGSSMPMLSPVFTPAPTTRASWPVTSRTAARRTSVSGGTTDAIAAPSKLPSSIPRSFSTRSMRTAYSSSVRLRLVPSRARLSISRPSTQPSVTAVFPASTARIMSDYSLLAQADDPLDDGREHEVYAHLD